MSVGEVFCLEMAHDEIYFRSAASWKLKTAGELTPNMASITGSDSSLKRRQLKQSVSDPERIELVQPGLKVKLLPKWNLNFFYECT